MASYPLDRYARAVTEELEHQPSPWGHAQPKFERIERDGVDGYALVGITAAGHPIRVQLEPAPKLGR